MTRFDKQTELNEEAWLVRVLINIRRDQWRKTAAVRNRSNANLNANFTTHDSDPECALIARRTVWRALDHAAATAPRGCHHE